MSDKSIQDQIGMADSFEEALRLITENPPKPDAKYNRQPVNMSLIKVDPERLQSRVETSEEVVQQYMMEAQSGDQFPPMVVFFDTEKQCVWLADGFHRHEMYRRLGYRWADCDVKFGTLDDAIAFAATANARHGLRITAQDRKKAAWMLFGIHEYWELNAVALGKKLGVSHVTISTWRTQYASEKQILLPVVKIIKSNGRAHHSRTRSITIKSEEEAIKNIRINNRPGRTPSYYLQHSGRRHYLGTDYEKAKELVVDIFRGLTEEEKSTKLKVASLSYDKVKIGLARRGISVFSPKRMPSAPAAVHSLESCRSLCCDFGFEGGLIRLAPDICQSNFSAYFGDAILSSHPGSKSRIVVLCDLGNECRILAELARAHGVEFLSFDEFVDSMPKQDADSA